MNRVIKHTILVAVLAFASIVVAQNVSNYMEQGGSRYVIGGSLDIVSGGDLDVESGASLKLAGTTVSSTAAELNILDGVTANAAELNILDGVTATAAELNASSDVSVRYVDIGDNTTYTVLAANSGKPHSIPDLTSGLTITLPTPASGLEYDFYYAGVAADAVNWIVDSGSDTNYYIGGLIHADHDAGAGGDEIVPIAGNGSTNSKLTVVTPHVGTRIKLISDGTLWLLSGTVNSATVPSFANQ